jgi:hypothetical protein
MTDRAIAIIGLAITIILGIYAFAPEGWPKVSPVITVGGLLVGVLLFGLGAGMMIDDHRRSRRPTFDILFDPRDTRYVRIEKDRTRYFVALKNLSHETVAWPSIRTGKTIFTDEAIRPVDPYNWGQPTGAILVFVGGDIDPQAIEFIELFGLPHRVPQTGLLSEPHKFTLEARGRDAKTLVAEFEYDPQNPSRIRRC